MADMDGHDEDLDDFQDVADVVVEGDETQPVAADDPFELLYKHHPETILDYVETVIPEVPLQAAPPTEDGSKDSKHRSPPFLTVYERTKILGARTNQLAEGAMPFVAVPEYMTQPLEIAKLELEQRRLPYIIKRPMPDGTFEYWRLSDLMIL